MSANLAHVNAVRNTLLRVVPPTLPAHRVVSTTGLRHEEVYHSLAWMESRGMTRVRVNRDGSKPNIWVLL